MHDRTVEVRISETSYAKRGTWPWKPVHSNDSDLIKKNSELPLPTLFATHYIQRFGLLVMVSELAQHWFGVRPIFFPDLEADVSRFFLFFSRFQ